MYFGLKFGGFTDRLNDPKLQEAGEGTFSIVLRGGGELPRRRRDYAGRAPSRVHALELCSWSELFARGPQTHFAWRRIRFGRSFGGYFGSYDRRLRGATEPRPKVLALAFGKLFVTACGFQRSLPRSSSFVAFALQNEKPESPPHLWRVGIHGEVATLRYFRQLHTMFRNVRKVTERRILRAIHEHFGAW